MSVAGFIAFAYSARALTSAELVDPFAWIHPQRLRASRDIAEHSRTLGAAGLAVSSLPAHARAACWLVILYSHVYSHRVDTGQYEEGRVRPKCYVKRDPERALCGLEN